MSKKIWVLIGNTGEYDSSTEWMVCAFYSKRSANTHLRKAQQRATEIKRYYRFISGHRDNPKYQNEFDPGMAMDSSGTNYSLVQIELRGEPYV